MDVSDPKAALAKVTTDHFLVLLAALHNASYAYGKLGEAYQAAAQFQIIGEDDCAEALAAFAKAVDQIEGKIVDIIQRHQRAIEISLALPFDPAPGG